MADRGGYIGRNPGDSSVIVARQTFEPTGVQTDFTFSSGYDPGYLDVYLNGSRLVVASDYTATDGSVVGLTSAADNGDVLECVAYKAFNVGNVTNATGNFTVGGDLTVDGNATFNGTVTGISSVSYATTSFGLEGSPNIAVGDITATGDVSIGGTLTYEDVTNVDSVGIITARSGIKVTAGGVNVSAGGVYVNAGVSTFPQSTTITAKTGGQVLVGSSAEATIGSYTWNGLQVRSTTGGGAIVFEEFNTNNWMAGLKFGKSRASTIGTYTIVNDGDNLGNIIWHGADGTDMACQAASIQVEVDGTPGSNDMPGRIKFSTTADGAVSPTERLRISSDGLTHISNNTTDSLHWNSYNCHLLHTDATDFTTLIENSHDSNPNVLGLHMSDAAPNDGSSTYLQCYDTSGGTTTVRAKITSDGTISDVAGNLRSIPLRSVTGSAATLVLTDAGKVVATDTTGWTVPALSWNAGDTVTLLNNSGGGLAITCSAVTTYLTTDGTTVTGPTLGARGMATLYFVSSSVAYLQGTSLS